VSRRHLRVAIVVAALTVLSLVAAAPSFAVLGVPIATTTTTGSPMPAFSWTAVNGAVKYEFQITDSAFNPPRYTITTRNTRATLTIAEKDGNWQWRVRGIDSAGNPGPWSDVQSWDKLTAAPEPAAPLNGDVVTYPTPLVFSWNVADGASKYKVKWGDDPTLSGVTPVDTAAAWFSPTSWLKPSGDHYWAVAAVDAKGHVSEYSTPQLFTWVWPSTVTGLTVADGVDGSGDAAADDSIFEPVLSWDPVGGAVAYDVEISNDSNWSAAATKFSKRTISTSISPNKILVNSDYYWRVRAVDGSGYAGDWSYGGDQPTPGDTFNQTFDTGPPTVPNLHMSDVEGDVGTDVDSGTPGYQTQVPIASWDPVPGASYYDVQVQYYTDGVGCNWSAALPYDIKTRNTAWTPLAANPKKIAGVLMNPAGDGLLTDKLTDDTSFCVRVRPERDGTVSASWQYIGDGGSVDASDVDVNTYAFHFTSHVVGGACSPDCAAGFIGQDDYLTPQSGVVLPRLPLFTWNPVAGALSYHVLISTDPTFATGIIDYGITRIPAYAPRAMVTSPKALPDFTTPLYWKVIPAPSTNGTGVTVDVRNGAYESFFKQTNPTILRTPLDTASIEGNPTFSWVPSESAYQYELQVSNNATFADSSIIEKVTTFATSYTSETKSYPADKGTLYWRVRAIDKVGNTLAWSATRSFTQTYPIPTFTGYVNPTAGALIPQWQWDPVPNAVSYDFDIVCSGSGSNCTDGTGYETTAGTLVKLTGLGQIQWRVRANFASVAGVTHGVYSSLQDYDRSIPAPTGLTTEAGSKAVVFSWDSRPGAKQYKVQVSRSTSFGTLISGGSVTTDNTSYAPSLDGTDYLNGGTFFWRVAEVDNDGNQGQWSGAQSVSQAAKIAITASLPYLKKGVYNSLTVTIKDFAGHVVPGATVTVKGAGISLITKTTGSTGKATFRVKPTKKANVTITASKAGYITISKLLPAA
jgi:hypothetical protein